MTLKEDGQSKQTEIDNLKRTQSEIKSLVNSPDFLGKGMEKLSNKIEKNESMPTSLMEDICCSKMPTRLNEESSLTMSLLAGCSPSEQKQIIGEKLFPLVEAFQPRIAGKITGMLLELDNSVLLNMMEHSDLLSAQVVDAVSVLRSHQVIESVSGGIGRRRRRRRRKKEKRGMQ